MTVDQKRSRSTPDRVPAALALLAELPTLREFDRTAGDEIQGVLTDETVVVDTALRLVRDGHWSVGIGVGPVEEPLPANTRAGRGQAFILARQAVNRAKTSADKVAIAAGDDSLGEAADATLSLLSAVVQKRSEDGWEAIDLVRSGLTQAEAAERLGVSKQAISARLRVALWPHEERMRQVAARLLKQCAEASG